MGSLIPWEMLTSMFEKKKLVSSLSIDTLPLICQTKTIEKMTPKTLFACLLFSKRMRAVYKKEPRELVGNILVRPDAVCFEIESESVGSCMWEMKTEWKSLDLECLESTKKIRVRGVDVVICWLKNYPGHVFCYHPDLKTVFTVMTSILLKLFRVKDLNIHYNLDAANIPRPLTFFEKLPKWKTNGLFLVGTSVDSEDVKFLLNRFPPQIFFHTDCNITGNFDFLHLIKSKGTCHQEARWLEPSHILKMSSEFREFEESGFETEDVIEFIRLWLESDETKIKTFAVRIRAGLPNLLKSEVIRKTAAAPWDKTKRDMHHIFVSDYRGQRKVFFTSAEEAIDVERGDGLLASIHMSSDMFGFMVWHDRFPSRNRELKKIVEEQLAASDPGSEDEAQHREILSHFE